jgi:hypothetical protein
MIVGFADKERSRRGEKLTRKYREANDGLHITSFPSTLHLLVISQRPPEDRWVGIYRENVGEEIVSAVKKLPESELGKLRHEKLPHLVQRSLEKVETRIIAPNDTELEKAVREADYVIVDTPGSDWDMNWQMLQLMAQPQHHRKPFTFVSASSERFASSAIQFHQETGIPIKFGDRPNELLGEPYDYQQRGISLRVRSKGYDFPNHPIPQAEYDYILHPVSIAKAVCSYLDWQQRHREKEMREQRELEGADNGVTVRK